MANLGAPPDSGTTYWSDNGMHLDETTDSSNYNPHPSRLPLFSNLAGVSSIEIGVTAFDCMGVPPPGDHPHVYLNMGEQADIQCPYCATRYRLNPELAWNETIPPGCWVGSRENAKA